MLSLANVVKAYRIEGAGRLSIWPRLIGRSGADRRGRVLRAVDGVSLTVASGEIVGVLGLNGAGKTTLLQIIAGVVRPTSGQVETSGIVEAVLSLETQFNPEMTGRENALHHFRLKGFSEEEVALRSWEAIAFSDLGERIDRPFRTYSTGMKARLAFACVTSVAPDILLIDETLSVGDASFSQKAFQRMRDLIAKGNTVIVVSHDLGAIAALCPRAVWLHKGRIRKDGPAAEVIAAYRTFVHAREEKKLFEIVGVRGKASTQPGSPLTLNGVEVFRGQAASPALIFSTHDPLRIEVPYTLSHAAGIGGFRLRVVRSDGLIMMENESDTDGFSFCPKEGPGRIKVDLGAMPFNSGLFRLSVEAVGEGGAALSRVETVFKVKRPFADSDQPAIYGGECLVPKAVSGNG